jgi:hypothetical protein
MSAIGRYLPLLDDGGVLIILIEYGYSKIPIYIGNRTNSKIVCTLTGGFHAFL